MSVLWILTVPEELLMAGKLAEPSEMLSTTVDE
jgi:hypothetical protein